MRAREIDSQFESLFVFILLNVLYLVYHLDLSPRLPGGVFTNPQKWLIQTGCQEGGIDLLFQCSFVFVGWECSFKTRLLASPGFCWG